MPRIPMRYVPPPLVHRLTENRKLLASSLNTALSPVDLCRLPASVRSALGQPVASPLLATSMSEARHSGVSTQVPKQLVSTLSEIVPSPAVLTSKWAHCALSRLPVFVSVAANSLADWVTRRSAYTSAGPSSGTLSAMYHVSYSPSTATLSAQAGLSTTLRASVMTPLLSTVPRVKTSGSALCPGSVAPATVAGSRSMFRSTGAPHVDSSRSTLGIMYSLSASPVIVPAASDTCACTLRP
mmetsp:Transcript_47595/g.114212  ORF Transcript_47595/g.114212 Transcript_47595/m.114212 type:complete len:240 (-) Transcript_47595:78-797(-)